MSIKKGVLALTLAALAPIASAERCGFKFTGTVDFGLPMAPKGAAVSGHFWYRTHTEPTGTSGDPKGSGYGTANYRIAHAMSLRVNGHVFSSPETFVYVVNNFGGNVEDAVTVHGAPLSADGQSYPEGSLGFNLASGPGKTHVLSSTRLPHSFDVSRYKGMNYGWVQIDGSGNGSLVSFVVDQVHSHHCD